MELEAAKSKFIQLWGTVGMEWGINRTMAQIHALLLAEDEPMTTDEVMERLQVSRGNANMNLRELIGWGLISREIKQGDRKEYFVADKNIWRVAQRIAQERKKRELDPMMNCLNEILKETKFSASEAKAGKSFLGLVGDIQELGQKSNALLNLVFKLDQISFFKPLTAIMRQFK